MKTRNCVLATVVAFFLASCGTLHNRYDPADFQAAEVTRESAVIVLSTGSPESCAKNAMHLIVKQAGSDYYDKAGTAAWLQVSGYAVKSDFTGHHGYLHTLSINPGSYYLAPRWINDKYILKATRVPKFDFRVGPGEVVYLGEFFTPEGCGLSGKFEIADRRARDLALLRERNPTLANALGATRMPVVSGYALDVGK